MDSQPSSNSFAEYPALPSGERDSPEWQAERELDERAKAAQGRLALGCCLFWLSGGGYLLTALPPMGDVSGSDTWMRIHTAEHLIRIEGENLHILAWEMKRQRIDDLRVSEPASEGQDDLAWTIRSITAQARDDD